MSKIALVDDDRNILTSVSMTLEAEGFEVETYNDGQAALDAFNKKMPDMAVLDIKMPRMDGMDLLQRLRQKSSMPVIFLTSKDDEIDEVLGLRMGADDYVKKPFSQRLLVERIRALLRRQDAVAGDVAVGIVDALEVIDVQHHQRHRRGASIAFGDLSVEVLIRVTPVVEPGQLISHRHFQAAAHIAAQAIGEVLATQLSAHARRQFRLIHRLKNVIVDADIQRGGDPSVVAVLYGQQQARTARLRLGAQQPA